MRPKCERVKCPNKASGRSRLCHKHIDARRAREQAVNPLFGLKVDATRATQHVHALHDAGIGWQRISELSGVHSWTLRLIAMRQRGQVFATTEAALLSVPIPEQPVDLAADGARVPIIGTQRRLRALVAIGYTNRQLAAELGSPYDHFNRLVDGRVTHCTASTARRAAAVFARLEETPAPDGLGARRSLARAAKRGWLPPIVWNPDTIDDPAAKPEVRTESRPFRIPPHFAEEYTDYRDHVGLDDQAIAQRFGVSLDTLMARLRRVGITPQNPPAFQAGNTERRAS